MHPFLCLCLSFGFPRLSMGFLFPHLTFPLLYFLVSFSAISSIVSVSTFWFFGPFSRFSHLFHVLFLSDILSLGSLSNLGRGDRSRKKSLIFIHPSCAFSGVLFYPPPCPQFLYPARLYQQERFFKESIPLVEKMMLQHEARQCWVPQLLQDLQYKTTTLCLLGR